MVVVSLCVEACASLRLPFLHKIHAKTMKKYPASQPVFASDKRLYIERTSQRIRTGGVCRGGLRDFKRWGNTNGAAARRPKPCNDLSKVEHEREREAENSKAPAEGSARALPSHVPIPGITATDCR